MQVLHLLLLHQSGDGSAGKVPAGTDVTVVYAIVGAFDGGTFMELKIEARNVELRKSWQDKIEEEKEKIVRLYANYVLHLRASIEATTRSQGRRV